MRGFIQVYTGNGKGKTTAALGLALRAAGAGKNVFIAQFVKGKMYSEIEAIQHNLPEITIKQYGLGCFIIDHPDQNDINAARNGLEEVQKIIQQGKTDVVILDEVCIAIFFGLFGEDDLMQLLKQKPDHVEIIITGRYASPGIIEFADLVTEMNEVKHYYQQGIQARLGIEF